MAFLKKMFGKKDPVEEMRKLFVRQDWAALLSAAKRLDRTALEEALLAEVDIWELKAGDTLAKVNLEEGAWAQKTGNILRAREDYQMAIEQARSTEISKRAAEALDALERGELPKEETEVLESPVIQASCSGGCTSSTGPDIDLPESDLDEEARMELLLATLPPALASRYLNTGSEFRQAWLAVQDGEDKRAMELLEKVPAAERNDLFLFERGALMFRSNQFKIAYQDLQAALTLKPELFPAFDALVEVLIATGRIDELESTLKQNLATERFVGYSWARLAELHAQRREMEPALAAGLKALDEGFSDQGLLALCANLQEQAERFDEAEKLLMRMPGGGCGGGVHPLLAEFWLRRGKNFDRALESFKGAMRQERDNPRWLLRISQVYQAKGWRKEATVQVQRLMSQKDLPEEFRAEVQAIADQLQQK